MEGEISVLQPEDQFSNLEGKHVKSANPWGKVTAEDASCPTFTEVLSEELAKSLNEVEDEDLACSLNRSLECSDILKSEGEAGANNCDDDLLLARMLQTEYDKEYNLVLQKEEQKYNGNCKVSLSFDNFRKVCEDPSSSSDDEILYEDDGTKNVSWDSFEKREKQTPKVGRSGIIKHSSGHITTKHDPDICGRRNATKVMQFPPGIKTGDGGCFDMVLPNKVYNKLKVHSQAENKRHNKLHDKKEKSTSDQSLDPKTRLIIFKLVNSEVLKSVSGCISTGKEATVFHGYGGQIEGKQVPTECALKVYKTTLNEFMTRDKYIVDDFRFRDRFSKQNPRKVIKMWAEKEYHNLVRLRDAGVPCPEVVVLKKNVLVMSFIGTDYKPAPKLKDVQMSAESWKKTYEEVIKIMKTMYHSCHLVHADLSEYNILWHCNKIWIIDVSQSVEPTHCNAMEFLLRDCTNITKFFQKKGVLDVKNPVQLFCAVTEMKFPQKENTDFLNAIQNYEKNEELLTHGEGQTSEAFDYIFENMHKKLGSDKNEEINSSV